MLKHSGNDEWLINWEFLKSQRKFPQVGSMAGVDKILAEKERQRYIKLQYQERKKRKGLLHIKKQQLKCLTITDNNEVNEGDKFSSDITEEDKSFSVKEKKKQHCKSAITMKISKRELLKETCTVADGSSINERQQLLILGKTLALGGAALNNVTLSKSSVHRARSANRIEEAKLIEETWIPPEYLEIHWDGKTFKQASGKKEERLAVHAGPPPKLLGTPKIADGTGQTQCCSVMNLEKKVDKWQLKASVVALVYDTTSANSEAYNGAAILIEKQIVRSLLRLECRHHIPELFVKATSNAIYGPTNHQEFSCLKGSKKNFITSTRI